MNKIVDVRSRSSRLIITCIQKSKQTRCYMYITISCLCFFSSTLCFALLSSLIFTMLFIIIQCFFFLLLQLLCLRVRVSFIIIIIFHFLFIFFHQFCFIYFISFCSVFLLSIYFSLRLLLLLLFHSFDVRKYERIYMSITHLFVFKFHKSLYITSSLISSSK